MYVCIYILKFVYHSLVGPSFDYGGQLRGQANAENVNKMRVLWNRALKEITFKRIYYLRNEIHKNLKILRFSDSVCMQNCLFMNQIERNERIAISFSKLKYCSNNHNYQVRSAATKLLDTF